jgi:hypothetical protein
MTDSNARGAPAMPQTVGAAPAGASRGVNGAKRAGRRPHRVAAPATANFERGND